MIEIVEVKTKKQQKLFVDFPTKLYKGVKQYVHPLRMDEINFFSPKKNVSYDDCEAIFFLAYEQGKVVGRISAIIQRLYNEKVNEKRVRFSRFDAIDSQEVANALFKAVENWAKGKGMNIVHGPLGWNDLDREGLLIEGFDEISTFEEQYNYPYYQKLIENCGYVKEIDWLEFQIFPIKEVEPRIVNISEKVLKRYNLHIVHETNKSKFIKKYKQGIFETLDDAYGVLYGVVPYSPRVRDQIIDQFKLFISLKLVIVVADENDNVIAFGFAIPSLSKAINKSKGKLLPFGIFRALSAVKKNDVCDFALIAVRQKYQGKGINAVIMRFIMEQMKALDLKYCETNLNLENNIKIQQQWKSFKHRQHKRRRCFVKHLS